MQIALTRGVNPMMKRLLSSAAIGALALAFSAGAGRAHVGVRHVLLISIDGMHALDFVNCANGIAGAPGALGATYCPNLAALKATGVDYLDASTPRPSDSFPGLMAMVSGATPRTMGVYYDVAYDRFLAPPLTATGNGVAGGACVANQPNGTRTEYEEGIDLDQTKLNGGALNGDGGLASIDPSKLIRDPAHGCAPVYPWNFVRTNTIFGVIHRAGGYTAWSDKHPAYSSVSGPTRPGEAPHLNDFYAPEINSIPDPTAFNGVSLPDGASCAGLPDKQALTANDDYTTSFQNIQCYDTLKVNAILNEINGKTHDGRHGAPVPNLFGMNFQAVSIGQKLIQKSLNPVVKGGYLDNQGTPSPALLSEIQFVDASIGNMITALKRTRDYDSTLIVITAKHGQSPVDSSRYTGIGQPSNSPITTSPATILGNNGCLPDSEVNQIGPTEDDVSLIWLNNSCTTAQAVQMLETQSPASSNVAGIGQIFSGPAVAQMFNAPGLPPQGDPRTPDIIVTPNIGVTYSGSGKKQAEHGGFAHDDTNVMLLVSHPSLRQTSVTTPVTTAQVAPTVLQMLGLSPDELDAVRIEGTQALPGIASQR
jgi:hypothetical protein